MPGSSEAEPADSGVGDLGLVEKGAIVAIASGLAAAAMGHLSPPQGGMQLGVAATVSGAPARLFRNNYSKVL